MFENITVSALKQLSSTIYNPTLGAAVYALITVEDAPVRWTIDGTTPTATVGHECQAGGVIKLYNSTQIQKFRIIPVSAAAKIAVTYSEDGDLPDPSQGINSDVSVDLVTTDVDAIKTAINSGLPESGFEASGDDDNLYNTIMTSPARECNHMHVAVGNGGVRLSLDGGTTIHYYIPANTERVFDGLVIPSGATIQAKKYVDAGIVSTNLAISIW